MIYFDEKDAIKGYDIILSDIMGEEAEVVARALRMFGVHISALRCGDREVGEGNDSVLLGLDCGRVVVVMVVEVRGKERAWC